VVYIPRRVLTFSEQILVVARGQILVIVYDSRSFAS
jgi:hypothetical protein